MRGDFFGDTLVGPTILQWGTEEQKKTFIPGILSGTIAWCQGFSEPDAGSDLASLKTVAELDGDEWVINGQKIWTTQGFIADYVFILCRTDKDAPKHKGISYLLCPMDQPGVEVRPIKQVDGAAEFAEVFLTDARCPKDNVVGGLNNGWAVAMTTLGFERGTSATTGYRRFENELNAIVDLARANGAAADPLVRQRLAACHTKVQIMRVNGLRSLATVLSGKKDRGVSALGATNKMFWSEFHQELHEPGHGHPRARGSAPARRSRRRGVGPGLRTTPDERRVPGQRPAVVVLLQPVRDHLGRYGRDPAQHRGRARPGPAQGAQGHGLSSDPLGFAGAGEPRRPPRRPPRG